MLTRKQQIFVIEYLNCWNASEAARRAGYSEKTARSQGERLLTNADIAEAIEAEITERQIKPAEILERLGQQARGEIGQFFKITERETDLPLPTEEIVKEEMRTDARGNPYRVFTVRRTVLDLDKLRDPQYSRLVRKFSDTKQGLSIELYDAQAALEKLGKALGVLTDRMAVTTQAVIAELPAVDDDEIEMATVAGTTASVSPQ